MSEFTKFYSNSSIHDLKVWSLSNEVHAMTVHIVIKDLESYQNTLKQATDIMKAKYKLNHVTIQIEVKWNCNKNRAGATKHLWGFFGDFDAFVIIAVFVLPAFVRSCKFKK